MVRGMDTNEESSGGQNPGEKKEFNNLLDFVYDPDRTEELQVEGIQDEVENQLMKAGQFEIARRYIIYREEHRKARLLRKKRDTQEEPVILRVCNPADGGEEEGVYLQGTFPVMRDDGTTNWTARRPGSRDEAAR